MKKILSSKLLIFLLAVFFSLPIILPFFHKGYFPTHDGEWAVVRLAEMFRAIKDHQFPVRYSSYLNYGYGYPLFNFAYPFPYYLGIIFHFFKASFVDSVKIIFALTVPLSFLFMYLASKEFWRSKLAGFVSAVLYVFLPYRMVDLYVRGSIGESFSFVFFAAIFYVISKLMSNPSSKFLIAVGAIFYAFLITSHNIMAILFTVVFILFLLSLTLQQKRDVLVPLLFIFIFGLGLSAFFWIPAIFEKNNILLSVIPIADRNLYYVSLKGFILPSWGYGTPTDKNAFTYQLGWPHLVIFLLTIIFLLFSYVKKRNIFKDLNFRYALTFSVITLFLIFFLFPSSAFLWRLPLLSEINYPWTMLALIGFLVSLLAGFLASKEGYLKYLALIFAIIAIIIFVPYAKPQSFVDRGDGFYMTNDATTTSSREYTPLWVKTLPNERPKDEVEVIKGEGEVNNLIYNSKQITFNVNAKSDNRLRMNTIYYPGWKAYVDGRQVNVDYGNKKGVMDVLVPKGEHSVKLTFSETPLRLLADAFSLLAFLTLLAYLKFSKTD